MRALTRKVLCVGIAVAALSCVVATAQDTTRDRETPTTARRPSYLAIERAARAKFPDAYKNLERARSFTRRLPTYWGELGLSERQTSTVYAIQEDYFEEIADLEARIARLEKERDAKTRAVLTERQRDVLDAKRAAAEKARKAKSSSRTKRQ